MISTVVVTYDSARCIRRCLTSLGALPDAEVIVVDNASRDDTLQVVRSAAPDAEIIKMGSNSGFARACNIGAEAADGSHVLFLNPDAAIVEVNSGRLQELLAARPFGLVAPLLEGEPPRLLAERRWPADYVAHTFEALRPREWRAPVPSRNQGSDFWVSGAMLLVLREEFLDLGGFDRRFFLYYEDRDLSHRYRNAHLPVVTTDVLRGQHIGTSSSAHDGLRAEPVAWSLMGWIQYVAIHEGEQQARRAASVSLLTLRVLYWLTHMLGNMRWFRAQRKARQLEEILRHVKRHASGSDPGFCPDARRLVRTLT